jgi:hypothetical protein
MTATPEFTFLMCSERSGSNLISRMFDAHPAVCAPTPAHLVRLLGENRHRYEVADDPAAWPRLLDDALALLDTTVGPWRTTWTAEALAAAADGHDLPGLLRGVLRAEAAAAGKGHVFLKENHLHRYLAFAQRAFPGLRIVAMVRDPRDMALSWKRSSILRGDVVRAARVWHRDQSELIRVMGWLGPGDGIHQLTYEQLVSDPEARLADACAFLGLDMDPAMLDFHRHGASREHASRSADWQNVARPVMRQNFAKWREGLDTAEAAYVERLCAEPMAFFGYDCEVRDDRSLAELEAELLPLERQEKPGWQDVPEAEKRVRGARHRVVQRIAHRETAHA